MKLAYINTNIKGVIIKKEYDALKHKKNLKVRPQQQERSILLLMEKLVMPVKILSKLVGAITGNI